MRRIALMVALLAAAVACGPKPEPKMRPQPGTGNREPGTGNGKSQQSPGERAMAEVLEALRAQEDRMCACTDAACVEEAEAAQFEWGFTHKELVDRAHGTPDQNREADTLIEQTEACSHKLRP